MIDILETVHNLLEENDIEQAKEIAENYLDMHPTMTNAYIAVSDVCFEQKEYEKAIEILDNGLTISLNDKILLEYKSQALIELGLYEEAKEVINTLTHMANILSETYGQWGFILSMEGDHKEAIIKYQKALTIDENDYISMLNMGISYKALYMYDDAISILKKAYYLAHEDKQQSIQNMINMVSKKREDSFFEIDSLMPLSCDPDIFNLMIPKNFDAEVENNIINIKSTDGKITIIISYSNEEFNKNNIHSAVQEFKKSTGILYSIIKPLETESREEYDDELSNTIFTTQLKTTPMFYAMAILSKKDKSLMLTLSSSITPSKKLINFAKSIIENIYFK